MPVLFHSTMIPPARTIVEIRDVLGRFGAHDFGVLGPAKGEPTGITFRLEADTTGRTRRVPVNWQRVYDRLKRAYANREVDKQFVTEAQARKTAWRQLYHFLKVSLEVTEGGLMTEEQALTGLELVVVEREVARR